MEPWPLCILFCLRILRCKLEVSRRLRRRQTVSLVPRCCERWHIAYRSEFFPRNTKSVVHNPAFAIHAVFVRAGRCSLTGVTRDRYGHGRPADDANRCLERLTAAAIAAAADRKREWRLRRCFRQMQVSGNSSDARNRISPSSNDMHAAASRRVRPANVRPGNIGQPTVIAQAVVVGASCLMETWRLRTLVSRGQRRSFDWPHVVKRVFLRPRAHYSLNIVAWRAEGLHLVGSCFTAEVIRRRPSSGAPYHVLGPNSCSLSAISRQEQSAIAVKTHSWPDCSLDIKALFKKKVMCGWSVSHSTVALQATPNFFLIKL